MHYFIRNEDTADTGLPMGYETGLIDDSNPAPKGSVIFESIDDLNKAIESAEKEDEQAIAKSGGELIPEVKPEPEPPVVVTPPSQLRWPAQYIPLTWAVDWTNAPSSLTRGQMSVAMRRVFEEFTQAGLSFNQVRLNQNPTLRIGFDTVDGSGGTLAFVYQPAQGTNMAACGGACGDYTFDNEERISIQDFENIFRHETGHAIGMDHTESGVMAPFYNFGTPRTELDVLVLDYIRTEYPLTLT